MTAIKVGYARVSTDGQDLTAQRQALAALGVQPDRIYLDHGITGTDRQRPGLREALAACRPGDTLAVAKLDRLARSVPDARDIVDELTARTRTRKCMANAKARGQLGGKQPTLNTREAELARCGGPVTTLASSTIQRAIQRAGPAPAASSTG